MAYEVITLNLIPSGEVPVIHAAQYDVDRPLRFALKLGDDDFDPTTYDLELQIRKVDNNIVTVAPASVSGNVVTFNSTEQMTACSGTNLGEIQITKDDLDIATLHFYLVVQRDVLAGGVTSESAIHNLTSQIAEIVPQVMSDDYYDKDEVDALIAEHTFDPTNYYDKSATDALLNQKADVSDLPDMTNYYDKTATDTLLSNKADKTVVDAIKLLPTIKSVSGSIATFDTDLTENLVNCLVDTLATKLVHISGNVTDLANYIRGIYLGNYDFVHLGSLTWYMAGENFYCQDAVSNRKVNALGICHGYTQVEETAPSGLTIDKTFAFQSNVVTRVSFRDTRYSNENDFKNAMNGVYLIYELATPITPTITQAQLTAICTSFGVNGVVTDLPTTEYPNTYNGYNNIFTDSNDISVKYLESIGKAISE